MFDCCVKGRGCYLTGELDTEPACCIPATPCGMSAARRVTSCDKLIKHMFSERTCRHECRILCYSDTALCHSSPNSTLTSLAYECSKHFTKNIILKNYLINFVKSKKPKNLYYVISRYYVRWIYIWRWIRSESESQGRLCLKTDQQSSRTQSFYDDQSSKFGRHPFR